MPKRQYKNKINNRKSNMALSEPSDPKTVRPEHFSGAEAQSTDLKNNLMKMIKALER